jgi:hypothetical protein
MKKWRACNGYYPVMNINPCISTDYRAFKYLARENHEPCEKKFLQGLIVIPLTKLQDNANSPLHRKPESYLLAFLFEKGFLQ